jgi:predicted ATPase/DNA-binding winged helix-turn-helix (wHTH) protein
MYRFGASELDPQRRELRHDGVSVHLEPQAFDLLVFLISQRERVVPQQELLRAVWGHEFLSDAVLTTRIKEIRRAVGDDGRAQSVIRNFRGKGYRFVADVKDAADGSAPVSIQPRPPAEAGLVGRDDDVRLALAAIEDHRLVTITGAGGVGKSVMARHVARTLDDRMPDGAIFVDLSVLSPGDQLAPLVARCLDIAFASDNADTALRAAARLDALLVVDECELHLVAVGALLRDLLNAPGSVIRVLTTSRVRLGMSGEFIVPLAPLHADAAVDLFQRRAAAIGGRGDIGLDRNEVEHIVEVLDRLPLPLEMAAARLGTMSLHELTRALGAKDGLAHLARHGRQFRSGGLDGLVAGSLDLLSADQRALFLNCSSFAGWFGSDDAQAIGAGDSDEPTVMALSWMAECSLLQSSARTGSTRYRMLATVKAAARAHLENTDRSALVAERHARWLHGRLQALDSLLRRSGEAVDREMIDDVIAEARVAYRWSQAFDPSVASDLCGLLHLPAYSGLWHEPAAWAGRLVTEGVAGPGARVALASFETHRGNLSVARELLEPELLIVDGRDPANALEVLADGALYDGDLGRVLALAARLGEEGTRQGDRYAVALSKVFTSLALAYGGDADGAMRVVDGAWPPDDAPLLARGWLHYTRGEVMALAGHVAEAVEELQRAVAIATATGHTYLMSVARTSWATAVGRGGDPGGALGVLGSCLVESRRNGNLVHALTTMRNLVDLLVQVRADRDAIVVWAGTTTVDGPDSYGSESDLLHNAVSTARTRLGDDIFQQCRRDGERLDVHGVLDHSIEAIQRVRN